MTSIKRPSEGTTNLLFRPGVWCGRAVKVLHETRVDPVLGMLWRCRSRGQDRDRPELRLRVLSILGTEDPDARELLLKADQAAWDAWHTLHKFDL